jgi:hypothetical protein
MARRALSDAESLEIKVQVEGIFLYTDACL